MVWQETESTKQLVEIGIEIFDNIGGDQKLVLAPKVIIDADR